MIVLSTFLSVPRVVSAGATALLVGSALLVASSPAGAATGTTSTATTSTTRSSASVADTAAPLSAPVTGTFTDAAGGQGTFAGTFTPTEFVYDGQDVVANGTLTGTLTDSSGTSLGSVTRAAAVPLDPAASGGSAASSSGAAALAVCEILDLTLRPIDIDLLGLTVHLDTVHLVIAATSGPGELLGNLLCAVVGLLDGGQIGQALANLLNQILAILNGLG